MTVIPQDKYQYIAYKASAPTGIYAPDELVKGCTAKYLNQLKTVSEIDYSSHNCVYLTKTNRTHGISMGCSNAFMSRTVTVGI